MPQPSGGLEALSFLHLSVSKLSETWTYYQWRQCQVCITKTHHRQ